MKMFRVEGSRETMFTRMDLFFDKFTHLAWYTAAST